MNLLSRLLRRWGRPAPQPAHSTLSDSGLQGPAPAPAQGMRFELLRLTLRDSLRHSGIPIEWVTGDPIAASTRQGLRGVHWRLTIRHWDPRLMVSLPAFQQLLRARLRQIDRTADTWLVGLAWELALPPAAALPPMPHPTQWAQVPHPPKATPGPGGTADVIAGPVRIEERGTTAWTELERAMAARDAHYARGGSDMEPTQPMHLSTRPADLD